MIDLSICIVNYNTCALLERCLDSIYAGTRTVSFEIIVVDNASTDASQSMVVEKFPQVMFLANPHNLHFTRGMNQAIESSRGRFVLLLNPDTQVPEGTLAKMARFLEARPALGAMGCRLLNPDGTLQRTGNRFPSLTFLLFETLGLNARYPGNPVNRWNVYADWDRTVEREVDAISGACLMVRRQVIDQMGKLDEGFQMFFEEVDWCRRIRAHGWQVGFDPHAFIIHYGEQSVQQLPRPVRDEIFWSSLLYYTRKYHGVWAEMLLQTILKTRRRVVALARLVQGVKSSSRDQVASAP